MRIRVHDRDAGIIAAAVSRALPGVTVARGPLGDPGPEDALITFNPPHDEDMARYGWVHSNGAGVDPLAAALGGVANPPVLTRTQGRMGAQMGEYCLAYALADLQNMSARREMQDRAEWNQTPAHPRHLFDQTVAVIGTGGIGGGVAKAFSALGCRTLGFSRSGSAADGFDRTVRLDDFAAAGEAADTVVAALPATPGTDRIVGESVFAAMNGALFMNVGRGATVDLDALRAALDAGRVRAAVLDVFDPEPLPADSWCWSHPKVTVTPHVSAVTRPMDAVEAFLASVEDFRAGRPLDGAVDIERGY